MTELKKVTRVRMTVELVFTTDKLPEDNPVDGWAEHLIMDNVARIDVMEVDEILISNQTWEKS